MNPHRQPAQHIAPRGAACAVVVGVDSGILPGLVVVDANRPAMPIAAARWLRKQFGAAH